jgi:hypothetical protein
MTSAQIRRFNTPNPFFENQENLIHVDFEHSEIKFETKLEPLQ